MSEQENALDHDFDLLSGVVGKLNEIKTSIDELGGIGGGGGSVTFPDDYPDSATKNKVEQVRATLAEIRVDINTLIQRAVEIKVNTQASAESSAALLEAKQAENANIQARLLGKSPAEGFSIWFDTSATDFIYIMEAPEGSGAGETGFRGVRIPLSSGAFLGQVQLNTSATLTFQNRATDGGWA